MYDADSISPNTLPVEHALDGCQAAVQYSFQNRELLEHCLTHASVARTRLDSNERLEFLGDAVLGAIVCEMLYHRYPEFAEGDLTRLKSVLVSRHTCAEVAGELGLEKFLLLGKGLRRNDEIPASIISAVFESLVAGIYLDGGRKVAYEFIERVLNDRIEQLGEPGQSKNFKSLLQQLSQKQYAETPVYRLLDEKGPDHSKCFKISAVIGPHVFAAAWGPSKKESEQRAAHNALAELEGRDLPHVTD